MMRKKKMNMPIYSGSLTLIQTADFNAIGKKYSLIELDNCLAFAFYRGSKYFICFNEDPDCNTVAHESLHVVSDLFKNAGIIMDLNNQEPQCYLLGWVVEQCHRFLLPK